MRGVHVATVVAALLAAATPALAEGTADPGTPPDALTAAATEARLLPLPERIAAVSQPLLGTPYLHDPAGEGDGPDPDPPGRYDHFDCLTFVEEVLSFALAADPADAGRIRRALRYGDASVDYQHRRHFMEAQWLPGAVADGWLRETTGDYGETITFRKTLDDAFWARWPGRRRYAVDAASLPTGTFTLNVLPLARAQEIASTLRPGSLVLVVRIDRPAIPYWITHLGFVLPGPAPVLRHASHMASSMRVRDHDLAWYVRTLATWPNWPVAGIAVFEPVDQGPPRRAP